MRIGITEVYKDKDMYRFIISYDSSSKGYESSNKKKVIRARANAVKTLKELGCKIYQVVH